MVQSEKHVMYRLIAGGGGGGGGGGAGRLKLTWNELTKQLP